jgi:transcription termination factor NusB
MIQHIIGVSRQQLQISSLEEKITPAPDRWDMQNISCVDSAVLQTVPVPIGH